MLRTRAGRKVRMQKNNSTITLTPEMADALERLFAKEPARPTIIEINEYLRTAIDYVNRHPKDDLFDDVRVPVSASQIVACPDCDQPTAWVRFSDDEIERVCSASRYQSGRWVVDPTRDHKCPSESPEPDCAADPDDETREQRWRDFLDIPTEDGNF